jgi:Fe-S oxidoreductase
MMMRNEHPELLPEAQRADARRLAELVRDPSELLWEIRDEPRFDTAFKSTPGATVAYHAPCHLRAQNVGLRARDLLQLAGAEVEVVEACSGVDGTWGMQARFHEESMGVARKMLRALDAAGAEQLSTDCPLAALRIEQGLGRRAVHPVVLLRRAYGGAEEGGAAT